jgi:hypothetical protein
MFVLLYSKIRNLETNHLDFGEEKGRRTAFLWEKTVGNGDYKVMSKSIL